MSAAVKDVTDATFDEEVLRARVPVLVDYWAEWCASSTEMVPALEAVADHYGDRLAVTKLDIEANPGTFFRYGAVSIPTQMVFRAGEVVAMNVGALSLPELTTLIESAL